MPERERVLLVDLCGTLYHSNTTFDFLDSFFEGDAEYDQFLKSRHSLLSRGINKLLPGDRRREYAVAFLKGHERSKLSAAAAEFLDGIAPIRDVIDLMGEFSSEHDRMVLVSSSLDFIVEQASRRFEFSGWHATELGYDDGICNGLIARDLLGEKAGLISREFSGKACTLLTDNREDVTCIGVVDRVIGVARSNRQSEVNYWSTRVEDVVIYSE